MLLPTPPTERQPTPSTAPVSATQTATTAQPIVRPPPPPPAPDGTLRLRGGPIDDRRVRWGDEVVDNEHMGKKKSKVCCIYHKPRAYDESSDESDESDSSSDESDCGHDHSGGRGHGSGSSGRKPNAYEKMPKNTTKRKTKPSS